MKNFNYRKKASRRNLKNYDIFNSNCYMNEARSWFAQNYPDTTVSEHIAAKANASGKIKSLRAKYSKLLDQGAKKLLGRKWHVSDYKVSCIGRDEFPQSLKEKLRKVCKEMDYWTVVWYAHNCALPAKHKSKARP